MSDPDERRMQPRFECIFKVEYENAKDFLADHASNASTGGIFIATNKSFEIGEELSFSISFPGIISPILCRGKVCWERSKEESSPENPTGIGVSFLFGSEEESEKIRSLAKLLSEPMPEPKELVAFRVLVIEDDSEIREAYMAALRVFHNLSAGNQVLEVIETRSGQEALEKIEAEAQSNLLDPLFDLVIVKLRLADVGGEKLIRLIRENESIGALPIIATSDDVEEDRKMAYEAGADLFLAQPIMMTQLFESLSRFLYM
jgi:uncharacterized protein (TIGR02266 family)